jgi:hypothetical protein
MLWMCNVGNLALALGLLFDRAVLIRVAVFWLIPGLPLWFYYVVMRGGWLVTSGVAHLGGLVVGLLAIFKTRVSRQTWLYALIWYLAVQQICRVVTPAELNVNIAHSVYRGWETAFGAYWRFWAATTLLAAGGLWIMNLTLLKVFPESTSKSQSRPDSLSKSGQQKKPSGDVRRDRRKAFAHCEDTIVP